MKNIFYAMIILICCIAFVACGNNRGADSVSTDQPENSLLPTQLPEETEEGSVPTWLPEETKESSGSTQFPEKTKESSVSQKKEINRIFGKWEIADMIGEGYIYGDVSMEDYVGGIVTISENSMKVDLPSGKRTLKNPTYKLTIQDENDFWEYRHADIDNGFGFKDHQIHLVEVYDGNTDWDEFGGIFWIRDQTHLIFLGPVYFLAKKIK